MPLAVALSGLLLAMAAAPGYAQGQGSACMSGDRPGSCTGDGEYFVNAVDLYQDVADDFFKWFTCFRGDYESAKEQAEDDNETFDKQRATGDASACTTEAADANCTTVEIEGNSREDWCLPPTSVWNDTTVDSMTDMLAAINDTTRASVLAYATNSSTCGAAGLGRVFNEIISGANSADCFKEWIYIFDMIGCSSNTCGQRADAFKKAARGCKEGGCSAANSRAVGNAVQRYASGATDTVVIPTPSPDDNDDEDEGSNAGVIGGVVGAILGVLALIAIAVIACLCIRKRKRAARAEQLAAKSGSGQQKEALAPHAGVGSWQPSYDAYGMPLPPPSGQDSMMGSQPSMPPALIGTHNSAGSGPRSLAANTGFSYGSHAHARADACFVTYRSQQGAHAVTTLAAFKTNASSITADSEPSAVLEAQLDYLERHCAGMISPSVQLNARKGRRAGGQGAVAFAQVANDSNRELAVKFFFSDAAFERETGIAAIPGIRDVMPPIFAVEDRPEALNTAKLPPPLNIAPLPKMMIVEKGESLDEFIERAAPDFFTAIQFLVHIAKKLESLHAAGWVHRDLKPGNTIWLPSANRWSLIDFGCACKMGEQAELSFSPYYAPPEVICAYKAQQTNIEAQPSADVWSFGVMSYELLTRTKMYGADADMQTVMDMLSGVTPLPVEQDLPQEVKARLGNRAYRNSITAMLSRDPAARPTVPELVKQWTAVFQQTTFGAGEC